MNETFDNKSNHSDNISNLTQGITDISPTESLEFKYAKVTFYFLILFCATFGNSMVVYVICTSKRMKSSSHLLILNLAVCDLFTPLVSIPFDFALEENNYVWMYGYFMCKILYPAATFSSTASSLTLAAISLERYRLLMHPFKKKLSSIQIKGIIIGVYIFSALAVSPYSYGLHLENGSCQEQWSGEIYRQLYTLALFLFQYAMPLIFMTMMYTLAIISLRSTSGKVKKCSIYDSHAGRKGNNSKQALRAPEGLRKIKMSFERKLSTVDKNPNVRATKMFIAVVTVFAIFMFPNQVLWIWADFGDGASQPHFSQTAIICWLFTYTNSVVNPIIFAIFSKDFRTGFKGVFRLIFCCNREALPEKCLRCEGTRTDSSTNEILSEKKTNIYENSTSHSNSNLKDRSSTFMKACPNDYVSVLDKMADFDDNVAMGKDIKSQSFTETRPVENGLLGNSDLKRPISLDGRAKTLMDHSNPGDFKKTLIWTEEKALECEDEIQLIGTKDESFAALHPNAIAILRSLPETDC